MLSTADVDITEVIKDLASRGVEAGYLVPTHTGLDKGIMDAHQSLRSYLKDKNFHDFESQVQGDKQVLECQILGHRGWIPTKVSLYRPNTKNGDPRIWIYGLKDHAEASNLLALLVISSRLYVVNASRDLWNTIHTPTSEFAKLLGQAARQASSTEEELVGLLKEIWARGFVPSTTRADNGVGDTLENLLGITRNSSKLPDFKGIELKASRKGGRNAKNKTRSTLFSLVPDWNSSKCKNSMEIVNKYGYLNSLGKKALQVTLSNKPNAQGLYLSLSRSEAEIENLALRSGIEEQVVQWKIEDLQTSLAEKHKATFWVKATSRILEDAEYFHYQDVLITSKPLVQNFGPLVSAGKITMDYTFSEKQRDSGLSYIRDHGYLWKMDPKDFPLVFPTPRLLHLGDM